MNKNAIDRLFSRNYYSKPKLSHRLWCFATEASSPYMNRYKNSGNSDAFYQECLDREQKAGLVGLMRTKGKSYSLRAVSKVTGYRMPFLLHMLALEMLDHMSLGFAIDYVKGVSCDLDW